MKSISRALHARKYFEPYELSIAQRLFLMPYFGINAMLDPTKGEMIAGLGDCTAILQLKRIHQVWSNCDAGQYLLKHKPLITNDVLCPGKLRTLDVSTLGRGYIEYMDAHSFSADERSIVNYITDPDLAYIMVRYRQIHDFWHVLVDLPPTVSAEIALKWFEWGVTGLPICGFSGIIGPLGLNMKERRDIATVYAPWALRAARRSRNLMTFRYEDHLGESVATLRKILDIEVAPRLTP